MKKNDKGQINKNRKIQNRKSNSKKGDKLHVKWKDYDSSLFNSWINEKDLVLFYHIKMSKFYEPYEPFAGDINVRVDLSN